MWAPGNNPRHAGPAGMRGFTLIELLLVVGIIAVVGAGVGFAVRDTGQTQLEREGQRLAAMLDSARARSRASGMPVYWRAGAQGFQFVGLPPTQADLDAAASTAGAAGQDVIPWLADGMSVPDGTTLKLGPEPIIEPQQILLSHESRSLRIATDGLRPFVVSANGDDDTTSDGMR